MLPTDLIVKPLATAEGILCVAIVLLGIAARHQIRAESNHSATKAPIFSHREKVRMLHVVQAFCLGMACALFGVTLLITHEHVRYSRVPSINLQITSTAHPTAAPHENR